MFRIAFDPDRPVIATSAFPDGTVAAGEVFDWRAKGLQPIDALAMFRSGLLTHAHAADAPNVLEQPKVETPSHQRKRSR